jgi:hypothetical protein
MLLDWGDSLCEEIEGQDWGATDWSLRNTRYLSLPASALEQSGFLFQGSHFTSLYNFGKTILINTSGSSRVGIYDLESHGIRDGNIRLYIECRNYRTKYD